LRRVGSGAITNGFSWKGVGDSGQTHWSARDAIVPPAEGRLWTTGFPLAAGAVVGSLGRSGRGEVYRANDLTLT